MARRGNVRVSITGDSSGLGRATRDAENKLGRLDRAGSASLHALGTAAKVGGAALIGGLAVGLKGAVDEYREAEKAGRQTQAVIKSTGGQANVSAKQVERLANSLSLKAGIDDEVIQSGENLLLTFTKVRDEAGRGNDVFTQGTKIALDMSVALGQDMKSSVIQVGKALNDPIKGVTALQRVGVSFTQAQKDQIRTLEETGHHLDAQKLILRELNTEFKGSAAAQADPFDRANVAVKNLEESLGTALAPAITSVATGTANFVDQIQEGTGAGGRFRSIVVAAFAQVRTAGAAAVEVGRGLVQSYGGAAVAAGRLALAVARFAGHVLTSRAGIVALGAVVGALAGRMVALGAAFAVGKLVSFIGAIRAARTAVIALNAASIGTGLGALLVIVGAVAGGMAAYSSTSKRAAVSSRDVADAVNAERDALKRLNDLDIEAAQNKLDLQNANIQVQRAEQHLKELRRSGTATALDIKDAETQLRQARLDQERAQRTLNRTEGDANHTRADAVRAIEDEVKSRKGRISTLQGEIKEMVFQGKNMRDIIPKIDEMKREQVALNKAVAALKSKKIEVEVATIFSSNSANLQHGFADLADVLRKPLEAVDAVAGRSAAGGAGIAAGNLQSGVRRPKRRPRRHGFRNPHSTRWDRRQASAAAAARGPETSPVGTNPETGVPARGLDPSTLTQLDIAGSDIQVAQAAATATMADDIKALTNRLDIIKNRIKALNSAIKRETRRMRTGTKKKRDAAAKRLLAYTQQKAALIDEINSINERLAALNAPPEAVDVGAGADTSTEASTPDAAPAADTSSPADTPTGPTPDQQALLDQANARAAVNAESARIANAAVKAFGSSGDIGSGNFANAFAAARGGPVVIQNINALVAGSPDTLRAVGNAATAGIGYQGSQLSPRVLTGV